MYSMYLYVCIYVYILYIDSVRTVSMSPLNEYGVVAMIDDR